MIAKLPPFCPPRGREPGVSCASPVKNASRARATGTRPSGRRVKARPYAMRGLRGASPHRVQETSHATRGQPHLPPHPRGGRPHLPLLQPARSGAPTGRHQPVAGLAQGAAGEPAALGGWRHRAAGRPARPGGMAGCPAFGPGDPVPPGPRADAGLHRGAGGGRPRGDARRPGPRPWRPAARRGCRVSRAGKSWPKPS